MDPAARTFWDRVHERWRIDDPAKEEAAVRSILVHLRRRLRGPEVRHLEEDLPEDVRRLWDGPEVEEHRHKQRPVEKWDFHQFLEVVSDEAGLADPSEAEKATAAVIHALTPLVGDTEERHLTDQLPKGLKELWREEAGLPPHPPRRAWGRPDHPPRKVWGGGTPRPRKKR